ncbi:MAG: hypothetical protein A2498_14265 [Lentisphaerae bacterium RIFOXYC12_FULL_60_16]|nr:MAG: hypothetical protein A2498_14265 [Lentisphaerae bacterium RIFOXYC12_FULL_60_16]OGV70934.1 MAG: hypothetical protein A2269_09175 [Lentisphaerae bacterium RIFOXYA12_FULL_60_10]
MMGMRVRQTGWYGLGILILAGAWAFAQTPVDPNMLVTTQVPVASPRRLADFDLPGMTNRINLTTQVPWDIVQLIEYLAQKGGLNNMVIGKGVGGVTTKLKFDDVTVAEALEIVLSVNSLAYEVHNGILTIMTDQEYKLLYGMSFYDQKTARLIELKFADPVRVAMMLEKMKSSIGTIVADPVTGTLILIDTPDKIAEMQVVIAKADLPTVSRIIPTETRTFVLQYADVERIQSEVTAMLTKEAGAVRSDQRTRTLIVTDLTHNMRRIEDLVKAFDTRPKQVFIEAKIVQTTLNDQFSLGINWNHLMAGIDPRYSVRSSVRPPGPASPVGTLTYNTIAGNGDLSVVLDALKSVGDTKILSNPHVAVLDGQEAIIEVITDQPYKELTIESGTTNITGVTYIFKKVGVTLGVTPRINDQDLISVAVKPEISSIATWYDGLPQEGTPVIRKSMAETSVMVKNGVTIIIGGMIENVKEMQTYQVPLLGAIPLLGRLFRSDAETKENREIVVFLTPRIVSGEEPHQLLQEIKKTPKPMRTTGGSSETKPMKPVR